VRYEIDCNGSGRNLKLLKPDNKKPQSDILSAPQIALSNLIGLLLASK
jgi:hypothetical protein